MMNTKRITSVFDTRDGGQQAAQALLQHGIAPERLYLFVGSPVAGGEHKDDALAGEATGALVGAGLTGLVTFAVPGIGILLGAATAVAALGITAASSDDVAKDQSNELEHILVKLGFMPEQARGYVEDVRHGRTLLSVDAQEEQTDMIADLLHRFDGQKLEFRRTEA
jgi:hypothetical protein